MDVRARTPPMSLQHRTRLSGGVNQWNALEHSEEHIALAHTHTEAYGRKTALSGRRWTMSSWPNFTHLYPFLSSSVEKKLNRLVRNQANSFELVFLQIYLLLTLDVLNQGVTSFSSLLIYFRHWLSDLLKVSGYDHRGCRADGLMLLDGPDPELSV